MNDETETVEVSPAELKLRKAFATAIQQAQGDELSLPDLLGAMSELAARLICAAPQYNDRRAACAIFMCQMVDTIDGIERDEEENGPHDPETCPHCSGQTVQ